MTRTKPEVLNSSSRVKLSKMERALETVNRLKQELVVAKKAMKQEAVRTGVKSFKSFHQRLSAARVRIDNCIATINHNACSLKPLTIGFNQEEALSGTDAIYYLLCQSGVDYEQINLVGFIAEYAHCVLKTFITHLHGELLLHTKIPLLKTLLEDLERQASMATQQFFVRLEGFSE